MTSCDLERKEEIKGFQLQPLSEREISAINDTVCVCVCVRVRVLLWFFFFGLVWFSSVKRLALPPKVEDGALHKYSLLLLLPPVTLSNKEDIKGFQLQTAQGRSRLSMTSCDLEHKEEIKGYVSAAAAELRGNCGYQ